MTGCGCELIIEGSYDEDSAEGEQSGIDGRMGTSRWKGAGGAWKDLGQSS